MDAVAWKGSGILWVTKPTCADVPFPWRRPSQKEIVRKDFFSFLSGLILVCSVLFCGCCYKEIFGAGYLQTGRFSSVLKVEGYSPCS